MAIGAANVVVEIVGERELPKADRQGPDRQLGLQRKRRTLGLDFFAGERNHLLKYQAGNIRSLTEAGIAHDVEVYESGQAESRTQPAAAGFFQVKVNGGSGRELVSGIECQYARQSAFGRI